jgi:hypothetical protein
MTTKSLGPMINKIGLLNDGLRRTFAVVPFAAVAA